MPKINRYVDISTIEKEQRKDFIDRHSAFVHCDKEVKKGEKFKVTVKVGEAYSHPDDFDHYIAWVQLFNGETFLAEASFAPAVTFGAGKAGQVEVTFNVVLDKKATFVAHAYCTKHGIWESDPVVVEVVE
ncbi:dethiobiotin synthase [bacterium]|nr:dethiobiotin synthase [bacterium]